MYKFLLKYGQLLAVVLSVVVVGVFYGVAILGINNAGYSSDDILTNKREVTFFDAGLYLTFALCALAVVVWVFFAVYQVVRNPKDSIKFIFGGIALVAVFMVFYFLTNTEVTGKMAELVSRLSISDTVHRIISGGLNTSFVLAGVAVLVMIGTEFINIFK
jgi:hypothetical protein